MKSRRMKWTTRCRLVLPAASALLSTSVVAGIGAPQSDLFETRIRPVLARNCYSCHTGSRLGGLRLDSREGLLTGGNSGPAIVPGDPDRSLLVQAVKHAHERLKMPMGAKKLEESEIADLVVWVRSGAPWGESPPVPPAASEEAQGGITSEQRAFWSFQPVKRPAPPAVRDPSWVRSDLDAFVLRALEDRGMRPAPAADRRSLLRRVYFDLIGLPPTPEEVDAFVRDGSSRAFAEVIDRLLASPRYGERWGRYWLDVARYSDDKLDPTGEKPYENSFRYRDWVIRAFNSDMPYDLFVKAQLAGDLMDPDPEKYAPGLGLYGLSPQFQDDRVDVTTRGFLGLTVACAQCHDHKFDPIPTKDFYGLQGIFKSTEEYEFPLAEASVVTRWDGYKRQIEDQERVIKDWVAETGDQLAQMLAAQTVAYMLGAARVSDSAQPDPQAVADAEKLDRETLDRWIEYLKRPEKDHPFLNEWSALRKRGARPEELERAAAAFRETALAVFREKRTIDIKNEVTLGGRLEIGKDNGILANAVLVSLERDKYFLWKDLYGPTGLFRYGNRKIDRFLSGEWKNHLESLRAELARLKTAQGPQYPFLHAVRDVKNPRNLRVALRGNPDTPGDEAPRRSLSILADGAPRPFTKGSGRLELAESIVDPKNPLTARVMVNRIWQHHFGRGIVATPSDFGTRGRPPSHPALLDHLAVQFVRDGWSIKRMHRRIMLSATYRQSSAAATRDSDTDADAADASFSPYPVRRLDAEAIRDAMLFVAGTLDRTPAGPHPFPPVDKWSFSIHNPYYAAYESNRRSVYLMVQRQKRHPYLALFDAADPNVSTDARAVTVTPAQALYLMNGAFVHEQSAALARRILAEGAGADDDEGRLRFAHNLTTARDPDADAIAAAKRFLAAYREKLAELKKSPADRELGAWAAYARVLLTGNAFLFVD
jgi:hypothetical protein